MNGTDTFDGSWNAGNDWGKEGFSLTCQRAPDGYRG